MSKRKQTFSIMGILAILGAMALFTLPLNVFSTTTTPALYGTNIPTADSTANNVSADVIGNKSDAAAAGAVSATESLMAYAKQAVTNTEAATVEAEALDALESIDLDHMVKVAAGTDVYPVPLTTDSIIAMIMCKGAAATASTYNNTTDSLEAIRDYMEAGTGVTTAIEADGLDHLVIAADGTGNYPVSVAQDSIFAMILSKSANPVATSYDNQTDSLEALRDFAVAGTGVTTALEADALDHLAAAADGTDAYPASVVEDSILAKILGDDATAVATTFNNTTDSLEALGIKTEQIAGADGIASFPAAALPANDVSIAEVLRETYDQADKSVSDTTAVMVNGDTLFTIANGPIEILQLVGVCITINDGTASTIQYSVNPTVGAATTISGASASLATAAAGSGVILNMTALDTAVDIVDPVVGLGGVKTRGIVVNEGIITIVIGVGSTTGTWKHYLRYRPLARGVTVTGS